MNGNQIRLSLLTWLISMGTLPVYAENDDLSRRAQYRLPDCHSRAIYFLPEDARLTEANRSCLIRIARQLESGIASLVQIEGLNDAEYEPGHLGDQRAEAVKTALENLGVSLTRLHIRETSINDSPTKCMSEYCRQHFRSVRLHYSYGLSKQQASASK